MKTRASALGVAVVVVSAMVGSVSQAEAASQCGKASWYSMGTKTASGERMNASALAAAHRSLPFGTQVRVENLNNGKSAVVDTDDHGLAVVEILDPHLRAEREAPVGGGEG